MKLFAVLITVFFSPALLAEDILSKIQRSSVKIVFYEEKEGNNITLHYASGTVIEDNKVVTCYHTIEDIKKVSYICVYDKDNKRYVAEIVGGNEDYDSMILKVENLTGYPKIKIVSEKQLKKGQEIYIAGFDFGDKLKMFKSNVKEVGFYFGVPNVVIKATPNQGRSGGGLFTKNFELAGVCTGIDPLTDGGLYCGGSAFLK